MYTDESGHTRFKKMALPLAEKKGLGSVGLFSSLFVNPILDDNAGDVKMQFAVTPVPDQSKGEGPKLAHTAPRRQLVITLDGYLEFKSCDVDELDEEHMTIFEVQTSLLMITEKIEQQKFIVYSLCLKDEQDATTPSGMYS